MTRHVPKFEALSQGLRMTRDRVDTVIRLLADYVVKNRDTGYAWEAIGALIDDAIRQAIQEEREACAQVADSLFLYSRHPIKEPKSVVSVEYQDDVGNAIRSRS